MGTDVLGEKKPKNRPVCKNTDTGLVWELQAPSDGLLTKIDARVPT